MKKIKVIDLLNIIANGEKIPKKIKWGDHNLTWCIYEHRALDELDDPNLFKCAGGNISRRLLNDEVEIIEDTPKEDKKIKRIQSNGESLYSEYIGEWLIHKERYTEYDELLMNKINEIIDRLEGDKQ